MNLSLSRYRWSFLAVMIAASASLASCKSARFEYQKAKDNPPSTTTDLPRTDTVTPQPKGDDVSTNQPPAKTVDNPTPTPPVTVTPVDDFVVKIPTWGWVNTRLPFEGYCGADQKGKITMYYGDNTYNVGTKTTHAYGSIARFKATVRCDVIGKDPRYKSQNVDILCPNET